MPSVDALVPVFAGMLYGRAIPLSVWAAASVSLIGTVYSQNIPRI